MEICSSNPHVNDLKVSKPETVQGWTLDVTHGSWKSDDIPMATGSGVCSDGTSWFGWKYQDEVGSISYIFKGNGKAILNYGNCFHQGFVVAHQFNNQQVVSAKVVKAFEFQQFQFEFENDDVLKISELKAAIIQFDNLAIVGCPGAPGMDQISYN